jgi:hypothetical protein
MPRTPADQGLLLPYTPSERSGEVRHRGLLLCQRAQRLRRKSQQLLEEARHLRRRFPFDPSRSKRDDVLRQTWPRGETA